ncbi:MAG: S41 family peptidase [Candidatus Aminicenantes bacterium]|nr:S41 family peptidase [Candidatus Aminicenantes bacterium]
MPFSRILALKPAVLLVFLFAVLAGAFPLPAQEHLLWLRYPAISPDGGTILFCYKGDIYKVPAAGGQAFPLTISEAYDYAPVWSHDGKSIAFASDRFGNFDVYVMPASGGEAKRLTFHSSSDVPSSFTADDKRVLFTSARQDSAANVQFPMSVFPELYGVSVNGGEAAFVLTQPAISATVNPAGDKIIYHDQKGYESEWRKHHTSSVTRDIWVYDLKTKKNTQLTTFKGEDRNPVFDGNGDDYYYLSEQGGSFNVYKSSLSQPSVSSPLTKFAGNPIRFLTRADSGLLCFGYDGEIYTMSANAVPRKIDVRVAQDGRQVLERIVPVGDGITEMRLSPNGKEIAYIFRGEIFAGSVEGGVAKRVTNTPWQERSVSFSPDGRTLVYAAEKDNNWNVYTTSIARKEEPYFYASTILKEDSVVATPAEEFQPEFSPDGKDIAYLENRVVLKVVNLASKQIRTILPAEHNYSYADGDQNYRWSPDGKWFLVQYGYVRLLTPQVGLVSSDGKGQVVNLTKSGFDNVAARWGMDGKMMYWECTREGAANVDGSPVTYDVYGLFFTRDAFDRFKLSKTDYALLKEQEDKAKEEKDKAEKDKPKDPQAKAEAAKKEEPKKDIVIELEGLDQRKARFTIHSADIADVALTKTGDKLFYLARFEKGYDLWVNELRTRDTKLFVKLGASSASMELSADGKALFVLADGRVAKIDPESGKMESVAIGGEMVLDQAAEKAYMFDHMWRQIKQKFLVADLYGADWDFYYTTYKKFLPFIANNYDYAEMLSELLGELNASHTGCYYSGPRTPVSDATASLGFFVDYDHAGPGLKVAEVLSGGPLDKATLKIRAGHIVEKIDGLALDGSVDHYKFLNRKAGQLTLLSVYDPASKTRWEEAAKPISMGEEGALLYRRWVKARRAEVDRLSGGRIGYVHVQGMNDSSFRTVIEEVLGLSIDKEALIVDTRFNGGGSLHDHLADFLNGKKVFDILPRGQLIGYEPYNKWIKPSIVLMGECNYSDAHLFPVEYKIKGIGKTRWERQIDPTLRFGIPQGGWKTPDGKLCENNQLEPDILVKNDPDVMSSGRDQQIEAAVKELLKK